MATGTSGIRAATAGAGSRVGLVSEAVARVARDLAARGAVVSAAALVGAVNDQTIAVSRIAAGTLWVRTYAAPTGRVEGMIFSTLMPMTAGTQVFFGPPGISTSEDEARLAISEGSALELVVTTSVEAGAGSYIVTVRRNGADTAMAVTLAGTGDDSMRARSVVAVPFDAMDWLSLKAQATGGAPDAILNVQLKYQFQT